jgi:hypothetical protein
VGTPTTTVCGLGASGLGTIWGPEDAFDDWAWEGGCCRIDAAGGGLKEIVFYSSRTSRSLTICARAMLGTTATASSVGDILTPIPPVMIAHDTPDPLVGGNVQLIPNEHTAPSSVTFVNGITPATGLNVTLMNPSEQFGLWIHRSVPNNAPATPRITVSLGIQFTLNDVTYTDYCNGMFRIADSGLEQYETFVGVGVLPSTSGTPTETFSSLPHTTTYTLTPPGSGTLTYNFVTNYRNAYGLVSDNVDVESITIDHNGNLIVQPPISPVAQSIVSTVSGAFTVMAQYYYQGDPNPAYVPKTTTVDDEGNVTVTPASGTWHVYLSFDGSNPLDETPISVAMTNVGGVIYLAYTTAVQAVPTTAKCVVRVCRASDGQEDTTTTVVSTTSVAPDFGTARLQGVLENVAEQQS